MWKGRPMAERKKQDKRENRNRDSQTNVTHTGGLNPQPVDEEALTEEELERAHMGWSAEDETQEQNMPDTVPEIDNLQVNVEESEDELAAAEDAITDMSAHEMRRDQSHRTGGDDHSPGVDLDVDFNAPKQDDMRKKKPGGGRGRSDWN